MQPLKGLRLSRSIEPIIRETLTQSRVVAVVGPRQAGKTTLVEGIAAEKNMKYFSMDHQETLKQVNKDPDNFITPGESYVFDEIQNAPKLIRAIKLAVDQDPTPGRFLITGSIHPSLSGIAPDSLAGRAQTLELLPFSEAELCKAKDPLAFLTQAFQNNFSKVPSAGSMDLGIHERILRGGYPLAVMNSNPHFRKNWLDEYALHLLGQDLKNIRDLKKLSKLPKLLNISARLQSQLVKQQPIARELSVNVNSIETWLNIFEMLYLIRLLLPWHKQGKARMVKEPKMHFIDSGLVAALKDQNLDFLKKENQAMEALMEGFVFSELAKMCSLRRREVQIYHYGRKEQRGLGETAVDFVLEEWQRKVVGIKVKASKKAKDDDFKGLRRLREDVGENFSCGVVLYLGEEIYSPEPGLYALPYHTLWSLGVQDHADTKVT